MFCQGLYATRAAFHQELFSAWRCREKGAPTVVGVLLFSDETFFCEGIDDAGHSGWADLLSRGEVAQGDGPSEDDDGKGREAWGVEAAALILFAELSQQVDGSGVELVGDILRVNEVFV